MTDVILDIDSVGDDILAVLTGREIPVYAGAERMLASGKGMPVPGTGMGNADPVGFDEELRWKFGSRLDKFNEPARRKNGRSRKLPWIF